jgi:hypothetical protein
VGDVFRIERPDENRQVAKPAPVGGLEPTAKLRLDRTATPCGLVLEVPEGREIALTLDDRLHSFNPDRPDHLVFEVLDADEDGVAERAAEVPLLVRVTQARKLDARVAGRDARDCVRAADRHDLYTHRG